eukprot:1816275-Pyramimonas_sp.AAC.1
MSPFDSKTFASVRPLCVLSTALIAIANRKGESGYPCGIPNNWFRWLDRFGPSAARNFLFSCMWPRPGRPTH